MLPISPRINLHGAQLPRGCERVQTHKRFAEIVPSLTAASLRSVETGSAMLILRAVRDLKLRLYYAAFLQPMPNESVLSTIFSGKALILYFALIRF